MIPQFHAWRLLAVLLVLTVAACGGGEDRSKAHVRLVNASGGYAALDLAFGSELSQAAVAYGGNGGYVDVDPKSTEATLTRTGAASALVTIATALARNKHYTVLAYGAQGSLRHVLLDDNAAQPDSGRASLRVINAAPDAGGLDVYLTASTEALADAVPSQAGAAYGQLGSALNVTSGVWRLRVTGAGLKGDLRLDVPAFVLDSRQVATLVLTPSRGGVLVHALLLVQQAGITVHDLSHARVRAVAGVGAAGAVAATVSGTGLMNGAGSPAVGAYALVRAGAPAVALSVNGIAVAAPATLLVPGGDYSLLVFGAPAAPSVAWADDDNRLPDAGMARVRLVNAVSALSGNASMTIDLLPAAENVRSGAASPYASVSSTTTAALAVTAAGTAAPLYTAAAQTLLASSNYSVFLLGQAGALNGALVKDR